MLKLKIQPKKPKIVIEEKAITGIYSDVVRVINNPYTFIIDFAQLIPPVSENENPLIKIHTRIIMSPQHAKALLKALEDNIKKWEKTFGEIKAPEPGKGAPPTHLYG